MELNPLYETIITDLLENQYAVCDTFFSDEAVQIMRTELEQKLETTEFKKSAIGNKSDEVVKEEIRGDYIFWLDEDDKSEASETFFSQINDFVTYINATCYMGISTKEFHYAMYPEGTFYKRHLDVFKNDTRRKLSIVCYLNDENWQPEFGGELVIYKPEQEIKIYPLKGRVVIFESQILEHEVKPVHRKRFSITGWLKTS
jgi:SM-20-related protein